MTHPLKALATRFFGRRTRSIEELTVHLDDRLREDVGLPPRRAPSRMPF